MTSYNYVSEPPSTALARRTSYNMRRLRNYVERVLPRSAATLGASTNSRHSRWSAGRIGGCAYRLHAHPLCCSPGAGIHWLEGRFHSFAVADSCGGLSGDLL